MRGSRHPEVLAGPLVAMVVAACSVAPPPEPTPEPTPGPTPMEIPLRGVQPSLPQALAEARGSFEGGLVEPGWLPDGFGLVNVSTGVRGYADLAYRRGEQQIQIIQADRGPYLPEPFEYGDRAPIGDTVEWSVSSLDEFEIGGIVVAATSYNGTMPDGRMVHVVVTGSLDGGIVTRVLESLYVRAPDEG